MKIILGASTRAVRAVDGVVGWKCWYYHVERERERERRTCVLDLGGCGRERRARAVKEGESETERGRETGRSVLPAIQIACGDRGDRQPFTF